MAILAGSVLHDIDAILMDVELCLADKYKLKCKQDASDKNDLNCLQVMLEDSFDMNRGLLIKLLEDNRLSETKVSFRFASTVYLLDILFRQLNSYREQAGEVVNVLAQVAPLIYQTVIRNPSFLTDYSSQFRCFITELKTGHFLLFWSSSSINELKAQLQELLDNRDETDFQSVEQWSKQFFTDFEKFNERIGRLESRIVDLEEGSLKVSEAQDSVFRFINKLAIGKRLPIEIDLFLKSEWRDILIFTFLREKGEQGVHWNRAKSVSENIVWAFSNTLGPNDKAKLADATHEIISGVRSLLENLSYRKDDIENIVGIFESHFVDIYKEVELERVKYEPISIDVKKYSGFTKVDLNISKGDYFECSKDDESVLCRLAAVVGRQERYLFVNLNGQRFLSLTAMELHNALESEELKPIDRTPVFEQAFRVVVRKFKNTVRNRMIVENTKAKKEVLDEARKREEKLKAELNDAKKRLREMILERKEEEHQPIESPYHLEVTEDVSLESEIQARLTDDQMVAEVIEIEDDAVEDDDDYFPLTIGSIINYEVDGMTYRLKLAAIINHTNRLVFVDQNGIKKLEMGNGEFRKLMRDGVVTIIKHGEEFESALKKVVSGIIDQKRSGNGRS